MVGADCNERIMVWKRDFLFEFVRLGIWNFSETEFSFDSWPAVVENA